MFKGAPKRSSRVPPNGCSRFAERVFKGAPKGCSRAPKGCRKGRQKGVQGGIKGVQAGSIRVLNGAPNECSRGAVSAFKGASIAFSKERENGHEMICGLRFAPHPPGRELVGEQKSVGRGTKMCW